MVSNVQIRESRAQKYFNFVYDVAIATALRSISGNRSVVVELMILVWLLNASAKNLR